MMHEAIPGCQDCQANFFKNRQRETEMASINFQVQCLFRAHLEVHYSLYSALYYSAAKMYERNKQPTSAYLIDGTRLDPFEDA